MKFYLAPMEGITVYIYRNAFEKYFNGVDKYFTPFIVPNKSRSLKTKEFRDIVPENNKGIKVVPQILTNDSEGFNFTADKLMELGYDEINLNLGCPAGTVVSKKKGAGFLEYKEELKKFLEEIYAEGKVDISIKTRLGKSTPEEFYEILNIYNQYPLKELIIHPRTREDFYGNTPNLQLFEHGFKESKAPISYNGDIFLKEDYEKITSKFSGLESVMIGRGALANPALIREIKGGEGLSKEELKLFHDEIFSTYIEVFKDEKNAMFRMKELWSYMSYSFSNPKKYLKRIKKAQKAVDYNMAVNDIFREEDILKKAGFSR